MFAFKNTLVGMTLSLDFLPNYYVLPQTFSGGWTWESGKLNLH